MPKKANFENYPHGLGFRVFGFNWGFEVSAFGVWVLWGLVLSGGGEGEEVCFCSGSYYKGFRKLPYF